MERLSGNAHPDTSESSQRTALLPVPPRCSRRSSPYILDHPIGLESPLVLHICYTDYGTRFGGAVGRQYHFERADLLFGGRDWCSVFPQAFQEMSHLFHSSTRRVGTTVRMAATSPRAPRMHEGPRVPHGAHDQATAAVQAEEVRQISHIACVLFVADHSVHGNNDPGEGLG